MEEATKQENNRNPDGTFKDGISGNPGGRPKNSLKSYVANKLAEMSDEEKEKFLKTITTDLQWRMGEGNPAQALEGDPNKPLFIQISKEIADKNDVSTQNTKPSG